MDLLEWKLLCGPGCSDALAIAAVTPAKLAALGGKEIPNGGTSAGSRVRGAE